MAVNLCFRVRKGLPPYKKSIFGDFSLRTIITLSIVFNIFMNIVSANEEISCTNVSNAFAAKEMLSIVDIKNQPDSDVGGLCSNRGCCGAGALPQLQARARAQLDGALRSELGKLADVLANRAQRFDEFFRRLLRESREEFHAMFKRTYGMIYEQHSYVFERLFERLERYYARGDADLVRTMDNFFGVLYQKMFTVLNSQYNFDDKYLKCVSEHMRDTQPFEDVPHKLSVQLRRAFVATRTFHKALRAGADVVRAMQQIGVSSGCGAWWARLRWCGACAGAGVPACGRYCHNVLRACLAHHADIEQHWDAYVDAVEKVADRLLGPFNIVMVVEPIDIKISEAIMNFQEHNQEISQKIFAGCGKPVLGGSGGAGPFFAPPERARRSPRYARSVPDVDWRPNVGDVDDFEIEAPYESLPRELLLQSAEDVSRTTARFAEQAAVRERFLEYMRGEINSEEVEDRDRRRRDADPGPVAEPSPSSSEIDFKQYEFEGPRSGTRKKNNKKSNPSKNGDTSSWGGPALEGLVREARARVRNSRRYWPQLPYVLCAGDTAPPTPNAPCFNGTHVASYTADRAGVGTAALASNPEVRWAGSSAVVGELDVSSQGARAVLAAVSAQQEALRALTAKLKDAYNGVDVQWRDDDDLTAASAHMDLVEVAGSGSGSGDDMDITDDDEDRNPSSYYPEGSGQRPPDDDQEPDAKEPYEEDEKDELPDRPTETETPFTPVVVGGVDTGNGNVPLSPPVVHGAGVDADDIESDDSLPDDTKTRADPQPPPPGAGPAPGSTPERGVPGAADRPSLERALFAYALPVVCAWFGTIVTDLF